MTGAAKERIAASQGQDPRGRREQAPVCIVIATSPKRTYEIHAVPRDAFHAQTTLLAIKQLVENAVALETLRRQQKERTSLWPVEVDFDGQAGLFASPAMREVIALAHRIAQSGAPVLITGETGVGKEIVAREIHARSPQASGRFVPYNCTAVPHDMMESQLFGHRRGAFTSAIEHAPGLIRGAEGGTVFLDEIGELSLASQPKLLRFLESSEIQPIGEPQPVRVNVRVIAATNADLSQLVREGRFREDLFYRLDILRLSIPPLRERREEIPAFCSYFLERYCRESRKSHMEVADDALEYLVLYDWPGNVRQLAAEMRRVVALAAPGAPVTPADLSPEIRASRRTVAASQPVVGVDDVVVSLEQPLPLAVEALERAAIERALRQSRGRVERAAEALGISRKGLFLKRRRLGLPVGDR